MTVLAWICVIATILVALALTIVVMKQDSKDGASAALGNNTFYGSNKGKTLDGLLSKMTVVLGIAFIVLCAVTTVVIR